MSSENKVVLLVDDDHRFIESCKRIFKKTDLILIPASSPDIAMSLIQQMQFHAIISDEHMPFLRGTQLLKKTKILQPKALRILITGQPSLEIALQAVNNSEVHRFFAKPFSAKELIEYIQGTR
jgi:DNA-binding NtrC family response regulator